MRSCVRCGMLLSGWRSCIHCGHYNAGGSVTHVSEQNDRQPAGAVLVSAILEHRERFTRTREWVGRIREQWAGASFYLAVFGGSAHLRSADEVAAAFDRTFNNPWDDPYLALLKTWGDLLGVEGVKIEPLTLVARDGRLYVIAELHQPPVETSPQPEPEEYAHGTVGWTVINKIIPRHEFDTLSEEHKQFYINCGYRIVEQLSDGARSNEAAQHITTTTQ